MIKFSKIIMLGICLYLNSSSLVFASQETPPSQMTQPSSPWPILALEVTNATSETLSANQIFPREVAIQFPDNIPSQQTKAFQLSMIGGNVRGFIYLYVKGQPAATRLSFDGKTVKVQEFMGQPLSLELEGEDCISMDGVPACIWVGNKNVTIHVIAKYTHSSPR